MCDARPRGCSGSSERSSREPQLSVYSQSSSRPETLLLLPVGATCVAARTERFCLSALICLSGVATAEL